MITTRKFIFKMMLLGVLFSGITPPINADFGIGCPELVDATRSALDTIKENLDKMPNVIAAVKNNVMIWPRKTLEQCGKILLNPLSTTISTYSTYRDPRFLALVAASGILLSAGGIYLLAKKYNTDKTAEPDKNTERSNRAATRKNAEPAKSTKRGHYAGVVAMLAGFAGILFSKHIIAAVDKLC